MSQGAESFAGGLFVPGKEGGGWRFRQVHAAESESKGGLASAEKLVAENSLRRKTLSPLDMAMSDALFTIAAQTFGPEAANPDPRRRALQDFFVTTLLAADKKFDENREVFTDVRRQGGDAFLTATYNAPILLDREKNSLGAVDVLKTMIANPALYSEDAQALLASDLRAFVGVAADAARKDVLSLSDLDTRRVKETTNGLYAQILFDILYAPYMGKKGYFEARDRYVATRIALQCMDDAEDVSSDVAKEMLTSLLPMQQH